MGLDFQKVRSGGEEKGTALTISIWGSRWSVRKEARWRTLFCVEVGWWASVFSSVTLFWKRSSVGPPWSRPSVIKFLEGKQVGFRERLFHGVHGTHSLEVFTGVRYF